MEEAMEEKSWRVETTFTFAEAGVGASPSARTNAAVRSTVFFISSSKRMGAVSADRELQLEKPLGGVDTAGVPAVPELAAKLRELARPERQRERLPRVVLPVVVGAGRPFDARARVPPLGELVLARDEPSPPFLAAVDLVAAAAEELAANRGGPVKALLQGLPAEGAVDRFQARVVRV